MAKSIQKAKAELKDNLQKEHDNKLIQLYEAYFQKALTDPNAFKAFNDCAKELFKGGSDGELLGILRNTVAFNDYQDEKEGG